MSGELNHPISMAPVSPVPTPPRTSASAFSNRTNESLSSRDGAERLPRLPAREHRQDSISINSSALPSDPFANISRMRHNISFRLSPSNPSLTPLPNRMRAHQADGRRLAGNVGSPSHSMTADSSYFMSLNEHLPSVLGNSVNTAVGPGGGGGPGGPRLTATRLSQSIMRRSMLQQQQQYQRHRVSRMTRHPTYAKQAMYSVELEGDDGGIEMVAARPTLQRLMALRHAYYPPRESSLDASASATAATTAAAAATTSERVATPPLLLAPHQEDGVLICGPTPPIVPWEQYYDDIIAIMACVQQPQLQAACRYRLQVLDEKYNLYQLRNGEGEEDGDRHHRGGGVFARCVKVDNHVGLTGIMNAQQLVELIQATIEECGDDVVSLTEDTKEPQTLRQVCEQLDFAQPYLISVDRLGLQPVLERPLPYYDVLDPELNGAGANSAALLRLFLTRDGVNHGEYLAAAVRPCLLRNEERLIPTQATETVVEFAARVPEDWERLAVWLRDEHLGNYDTNQFIISLSLDAMHKTALSIDNYQQLLDRLFMPLFLATIAPEDGKNSAVAALLARVGGFIVVPSEAAAARSFRRSRRRPADVPWPEPVNDLYFAYYVWANTTSLNALRRSRGLNELQLRAVAGASRSAALDEGLVFSFLLCCGITGGVGLESHPVLQYLYGLHGISVAMSPCSSNSLGLPYMEHPLPRFYRRGLRVSLCTDRPLLSHYSMDPLTEEYGMACRLYRLSGVEVCELAYNSVACSSFPPATVARWLGESYVRDGWRGNVFELSNVPTARLEHRHRMWATEEAIIASAPSASGAAATAAVVGASMETSACPRESQLISSEQHGAPLAQSTSDAAPRLSGTRRTAHGSTELASTTHLVQLGDKPRSCPPYVVVDPRVAFPRVLLVGPYDRDVQHAVAAQALHRALELRQQYVRQRRVEDQGLSNDAAASSHIELAFRRDTADTFNEDEWMYKTVEGVIVPHEVHQIPRLPTDLSHYADFIAHVEEIRMAIANVHVRAFTARRLQLLEHQFRLHLAVNHSLEAGSTSERASQNRDFYQATKVDNFIRMENGMTARQLLDFIVDKAQTSGDDIVSHRQGREPQTLRQLLQELHISVDSLTVDDLDVQVDTTLGGTRGLYTPEGRGELLTLLLKTDNQMSGRYFAELIQRTFGNYKRDRFTFTESRLPVYGASRGEWAQLSAWFDTHGMASSHNRWMIEFPRIYGYLRRHGKVRSFAEYLENLFSPLWHVSLHPTQEPRLFHFANHISGFDCVEDERSVDVALSMATTPPHAWTREEDPPYGYYLYHIWANISTLNDFRRRRRFSTFAFRPSCGEAGAVEHLISGFLLAQSISYGVQLGQDAPLQYLFYLAQIGVTVSPLSNNTKVLDYLDNPFPAFFRRGLKVSLGTDCPLMYHHTQEPLLEEYSIASKIWKLSPNDMCEVARNSVLLSGFDAAFKCERLGALYFLSSSASNDASRTHLSDIRVAYRFDTYHSEMGYLEYVSGLSFARALLTLAEEEQRTREALEGRQRAQDHDAPQSIIESTAEEADLIALRNQRALMEQQAEQLAVLLSDLQHQNRQLTDMLREEHLRDQQAKQLRRHDVDSRLDELSALLHQAQTKPSAAQPAQPPAAAHEAVSSTISELLTAHGAARVHEEGEPTLEAGAGLPPSATAPSQGPVTSPSSSPRSTADEAALLHHAECLWSAAPH